MIVIVIVVAVHLIFFFLSLLLLLLLLLSTRLSTTPPPAILPTVCITACAHLLILVLLFAIPIIEIFTTITAPRFGVFKQINQRREPL